MKKTLRRTVLPVLGVLAALAGHSLAAPDAAAQSLRGSRASVDRMYNHALGNGIYFYRTGKGIRDAAAAGRFTSLTGNASYGLGSVSYPYVRPETRTFVERLAVQYRNACGQKLIVTSGSRPREMRLINSADRSVHPTGMAVDLRKPRTSRCLSWLRTTLLQLERAGVVEATEEFNPPHFHVAVFPTPYARYVSARGGAVRVASAASTGNYKVRPGDSLWAIARRHSITVERLRAVNGLSSSFLKIGQTLLIPE